MYYTNSSQHLVSWHQVSEINSKNDVFKYETLVFCGSTLRSLCLTAKAHRVHSKASADEEVTQTHVHVHTFCQRFTYLHNQIAKKHNLAPWVLLMKKLYNSSLSKEILLSFADFISYHLGLKMTQPNQPDHFKRWLIRTTSLVQIHTVFAKSYVFYELPIRMNLYEWPTPNPAPLTYPSLGFRQIILNRTSEVLQISHLVKYVRIAVR